MIRFVSIMAMALSLTGCYGAPAPNRPYQVPQNLGQYTPPAYLVPQVQPVPLIPPVDICRSQLYQGLIGRSEGTIFIAGLPNPKRILKPAFDESFGYQPEDTFYQQPSLVEVRDYLPNQSLYAPSIQTISDIERLGPVQGDRITIELDIAGVVQDVRCE